MRAYSLESPPRRRRPIAVACLAVASALLGATSVAVVDIARWRDAGEVARAAASDPNNSVRNRLEAQVILRRDISQGITILRANSQIDNSVGQGARNALQMIEESLR